MSVFNALKDGASTEWRRYVEHPFTNALADGTLPQAAFRFYLAQDYLFLIEFARAYGLAVYKAPTLPDMREAARGLAAILDVEMDLHVSLCAAWGLGADQLERTPMASATLAYTRYVLDAGMRGDFLTLKVALAPCVIGYAEIARRLAARPGADGPGNPYRAWIADYAGPAYQALAAAAIAQLDDLGARYLTPTRMAEAAATFSQATRLETNFWEIAWRVAGEAAARDQS